MTLNEEQCEKFINQLDDLTSKLQTIGEQLDGHPMEFELLKIELELVALIETVENT